MSDTGPPSTGRPDPALHTMFEAGDDGLRSAVRLLLADARSARHPAVRHRAADPQPFSPFDNSLTVPPGRPAAWHHGNGPDADRAPGTDDAPESGYST
ncbi:hypothetical protein O7632_27565 [Solwaraspora sp. WMMD406]|uniref:hypothetical protein n=1 Tax=Solwaraspora sp. WMMD406 TaxID=3016095 RepID=UPI0024172218|nr:hypothetical protein [Solwaraspora sp. WMMD406]MDG4767824.1 hypothetical protein [Solwaraspora sp. WMMD406]